MQLCKYGNEDLKLKQEPDREASPTEHKRWKDESQVLRLNRRNGYFGQRKF